MSDQSNSDTRAAFEAHFALNSRQKWQHKDGSYQFPEIQAKWEGWQAGVAKAAPVSVLSDCDIIAIANKHIEGWIANDKSVILECVTTAIREALQSAAAAPGAGQTEPVAYRAHVAEQVLYVRAIADYLQKDGMPNEAQFLQALALELEAQLAAAAPGADERIAQLEAALFAAHGWMQNNGHYQDDATMPLFKQIACALPRL